MEDVKRSLTFSMKGNTYTITFPTVGQFLEIETRRMALSKGMYNNLLNSRMISSRKAMDLIDAVATLTVLCPDIINDTKTKDLLTIDIMDAKELLDIYAKEVSEWVGKWMSIFTGIMSDEKE